MKKFLLHPAAVLLVLLITSFAGTGTGNIPATKALTTCTCSVTQFNSCLNLVVKYTFQFDCATRTPTGVLAEDSNGNPLTVQGFVVNYDNTLEFALIKDCDLAHMKVTYNFTFGCGVSISIFNCLPGGAC